MGLRAVLDLLPDGVLVALKGGRIAYVNQTLERMLGYATGSLLGGSVDALVPEAKRGAHAASREGFEAAPIPRSMGASQTLYARRSDGSALAVDVSLAPIDWSGEAATLAVVRDRSPWQAAADEARLRSAALDAAANGVVITDRAGRIAWVNAAFTSLTGYAREEAIGGSPRLLRSGHHGARFYETMWETVISGEVWHGDTINRRKDGSLYIDSQYITPIRGLDGEVHHFVAIKQDVTELRLNRRILDIADGPGSTATTVAEHIARTLETTLEIPGISIHLHGSSRLDRTEAGTAAHAATSQAHAPQPTRAGTLSWVLEEAGRSFGTLEVALPANPASAQRLRALLEPLRAPIAARLGRALLYEELQRRASHDELTGLSNRRALFEALERELPRSHRYARPLSVLMLDLDHFKRINDEHGHAAGDAVLRSFARACRHQLRSIDVLGRYGGEEFLAVLPETGAEGAKTVAERIRVATAATRWPELSLELHVTVSIGVAELARGEAAESLLRRADEALYEAKRAGRDRVQRAGAA